MINPGTDSSPGSALGEQRGKGHDLTGIRASVDSTRRPQDQSDVQGPELNDVEAERIALGLMPPSAQIRASAASQWIKSEAS